MGFRDALPVCVDEREAGNERDDVGERVGDLVAVLERVDDRVAVLDCVADLVVVSVLLGVRECVGMCDGVRLDDGVPAGVGNAVRVSLALVVCEPTNGDDADAGCVGNAVRDGDDVCVREPDSDGVRDVDGDVVSEDDGVCVCDEDDVPVSELAEVLVAVDVGIGDGKRRMATLRLRTVAFATPSSLASQEYTDCSAPLVIMLVGTSAVTLT